LGLNLSIVHRSWSRVDKTWHHSCLLSNHERLLKSTSRFKRSRHPWENRSQKFTHVMSKIPGTFKTAVRIGGIWPECTVY